MGLRLVWDVFISQIQCKATYHQFTQRIGNIVSFIDYIAGRRHGIYYPNQIPNYLFKQAQTTAPKTTPLDIMKDEIFRTIMRKQLGNL
jgi:hypothetical protein